MGFELDSTWQQSRGVGQGLENQGATCYVNSIVQCLVHNPILANLAFGTLRETCKCIKCALCYLAFRTRCSFDASNVTSERKASCPKWMISAGLPTLGTLSNERLSACKQEDAHDFLRQWLDKVHDLHEKILKSGLPSKQPVYTIIDQVFGGVLASRVECQHCGQVSSMYDSMNDLSVEVDNGSYGVVKSVEIALGKFVQPEVMSGENAYHCDWCQRKQTAHKSLHIHTAPNTLTLHLKRFRPDFVKLTGHIAFPLTLNLAPFLSPDSPEKAPHSAFCQEPAACPHQQPAFPQRATGFAQKGHAFSEQRVTYRLIGVLVHKGSWSSAGHYFSYVLDSAGQWWLMNDALCYQVSTDEVINKCDAYILFYVRHRPRQQYPVVPPSHVAKPSTRNRCPPLSPSQDGEVGEAAQSGPLVKQSRLHQQQPDLLHARLSSPHLARRQDPVLAGPQDESQPAADSGMLLSHMAAYGQDSEAGASNSMHIRANGGNRCNGSSGDHGGLSKDQASSNQQSQSSAEKPSWLAAHANQVAAIAPRHGTSANPDQGAAKGSSWDPVSSPGAVGASPKPVGCSSFSLGSSKFGKAPPKRPQGSGSNKAAACLLPPNLTGANRKAVLANEQPRLYSPGIAAGAPVSRAGLKRPRPDSGAEPEQELELVLDDNSQAGPDTAKGSSLPSAAEHFPVNATTQSRQAPVHSASTGLMLESDASHHNSLSFSQQQHTMHASKQQLPQQLPTALSQQQRTKQHHSDQLTSLHQRLPAPSFMGRKQPSWSRPLSDLLSTDAPPHIKYAPPQARSQLLGNPSECPPQQQLPLAGGFASHPKGHLGGFPQANGNSSQGMGALPAASLAATGSTAGDQIARDAFPMSFGSNRKVGIAHHSWQARADPELHRPDAYSDPSPPTAPQLALPTTAATAKPISKASASSDTAGRTSSAAGPARVASQVASDALARQNHAGVHAAAKPGPLLAEQQEAAREGSGSGRSGNGHKSARKPGMLGRMKSTVT
ncbi:TPA: Ubiquitin carboxyl-terminal hydrolase 24, variant 2 [Trebouxia sp. C0004]